MCVCGCMHVCVSVYACVCMYVCVCNVLGLPLEIDVTAGFRYYNKLFKMSNLPLDHFRKWYSTISSPFTFSGLQLFLCSFPKQWDGWWCVMRALTEKRPHWIKSWSNSRCDGRLRPFGYTAKCSEAHKGTTTERIEKQKNEENIWKAT